MITEEYPDFVESTGYGEDPLGLCGINCYHQFYPFIPGVSTRLYTDEQLDKMNAEENEKKAFNGKTYTKYEATQYQRKLETVMRKQKQDIKLLKEAGLADDSDDVTFAKCRYQKTVAKYKEFSKEMGLSEHWDRVNTSGLKSVQNKDFQINIENVRERGIIKIQRNMANGLRKSPQYILNEQDIQSVLKDAEILKIPKEVLLFNEGTQTGFSDRYKIINIRGDVFPDIESHYLRDRLSVKAVLAHEYYGHYQNHPSEFKIGDWRDEFRASYRAAIDAPGLSDEERGMLMIDAFDRAKEAGISVKYNNKARRIIYGYND